MFAVTFSAPGGPDVLGWTEIDPPAVGHGDVRIAVAAAGVNNADLMQRRGHYPVPAGASPILGLECSGTISEIGPGVDGWTVGDEVCALLTGGAYAEQVVVPATQLLPVPSGVSLVDAAALPEVACTVYSNLRMLAGLSSGATLLVHGGGSGIGTMATQWATAIGVTVITTAGSTSKLARSRELGAALAINYHEEDFVAETLEYTSGRGVDAILDIVGADYFARNLQCLAPDGHLVVIGSTGAPSSPPLDLGLLMSKRASVTATTLRGRPRHQKAAIVAAVRKNLWPLVDDGRIVPVVDSIFPMTRAGDAHQLLTDGGAFGKVLLTT